MASALPISTGSVAQTYVCNVCQSVYPLASRLSRHMITHGAGVVCPQCGAVLKTKDGLTRHLRLNCSKVKELAKLPKVGLSLVLDDLAVSADEDSVPPEGADAIYCSICGQTQSSINLLMLHMVRIHCPSSMLNTCLRCGKTLDSALGLACHIRDDHVPLDDSEDST